MVKSDELLQDNRELREIIGKLTRENEELRNILRRFRDELVYMVGEDESPP